MNAQKWVQHPELLDAPELQAEVAAILDDGGDVEDILKKAKDRSSVLHKMFDWNDRRMAEQARLEIASFIKLRVQAVMKPRTPKIDIVNVTGRPRAANVTLEVSADSLLISRLTNEIRGLEQLLFAYRGDDKFVGMIEPVLVVLRRDLDTLEQAQTKSA